MKIITAALVTSALLTQASYAQSNRLPTVTPLSAEDKAEIVQKRLDEKANDEAYKALIKRTPDKKNEKVDPWGNMRAPSASGNK
jgi:hypothetical protein